MAKQRATGVRRRPLAFTNEGGRQLAAVLEKRGMTLAQAEAKLELAEGSGLVTRLIRGDRKPGRMLAWKLKQLFGISFEAWEQPVTGRTGTDG